MAGRTNKTEQEKQTLLSHRVPVVSLPADGRTVEIVATKEELLAIADACNLVSVDSFTAHFFITKGRGSLIAVQGSLDAGVIQTCGVTLESVEEHVCTDIGLTYTLDSESRNPDAIEFDYAEDDPPEPVIEGHIDFGTVAMEHFALNLNPYPRKPQALFSSEALADQEKTPDSAASGPFSALSSMKDRKNKE